MRTKISNYNTRNKDKSTPFHTKHNLFIFLLPRLLNGTSQILIFKVPLILVFSKRIRPSPNNAFNCHNCKETNNCKYLTRLRLGLSHWLNINLNIVFLILWIYFVCVTLILKQIPIFFFFFFTVPYLVTKDAPSWAQLMILIVLWQSEVYRINKQSWRTSFLVFCNFLIYVYLFNFFCILISFFEAIHWYSFSC